jgi:hypothetical protein
MVFLMYIGKLVEDVMKIAERNLAVTLFCGMQHRLQAQHS